MNTPIRVQRIGVPAPIEHHVECPHDLWVALTCIVDAQPTTNTDGAWRIVNEYRAKLGKDVIMKAAQDAALKLRKSRAPTSLPTRASRR